MNTIEKIAMTLLKCQKVGKQWLKKYLNQSK